MVYRSVPASHLERIKPLPGDEVIPERIGSLTHAITIRRPRHDVWPWLAQMGAGSRAGWYSYDFLDKRPAAKRRTHRAGVAAHCDRHLVPGTPGRNRWLRCGAVRAGAVSRTRLAGARRHLSRDLGAGARRGGVGSHALDRPVLRSWGRLLLRVAGVARPAGRAAGAFPDAAQATPWDCLPGRTSERCV